MSRAFLAEVSMIDLHSRSVLPGDAVGPGSFAALDIRDLVCGRATGKYVWYPAQPSDCGETYVHQNKHLPDVLSECDAIEKGIDVGEMNKVLLQKVEELTLYLIQQQKEIDALKNK